MQPTAAKALVRSYFYQEFLLGQLPAQLLRGCNHLVLLGDAGEEEKLLRLLGVPDYRVFCVERDNLIFNRLSGRSRSGEYQCVLYFGELTQFISHHLHSNQRFGVLNLDIYGAYRTGIDPVMTDVLLFARRNPQTVIASYSNCARDRPQLRDGLRSLLVLYWLAPGATEQAINELFKRYRAGGLSRRVSINMVLRNLFWIRSNLERCLCSAVAAMAVQPEQAQSLLDASNGLWQRFAGSARPNLTYKQLLGWLAKQDAPTNDDRLLDLKIEQLSIATYEADGGFYHTGWFALYRRTVPQSVNQWLEGAMAALYAQPLRFTSRHAVSLSSIHTGVEDIPDNLVVWRGSDYRVADRQVKLPVPSAALQQLEVAPASEPEEYYNPPLDMAPLIRELAQQGLNTSQIVERLPQHVSRGTVTAHIALYRRRNGSRPS